MGTTIRAEISRRNQYWISKHRYYELKLLYLTWPWYKAFCDRIRMEKILETIHR